MKPALHAFEIGYSPKWELIDHSEVYLDHLPGTEAFHLKVLPRYKEVLPATTLAEVEQSMALLPRIEDWVKQPAVLESVTIGNDVFTLNWERPAERTGVYSIRVNDQLATMTLLICRDDDQPESDSPNLTGIKQFMAFTTALNRFLNDDPLDDFRKLRLIDLTRRPLMASMFWPPYAPANDTVARTIQRQFAYAFFQSNGEIA